MNPAYSPKPTGASFEAAVVGTLLETPNLDGDNPNLLNLVRHAPESFDDQRCGLTAAAIRSLQADGRPVHSVAVSELLKFDHAVEFLMLCQTDAIPLSCAEPEAEKLWHKFQARRTAQLLSDAADAATRDPEHAQNIREHVVAELQRLDSEHSCDGLTIRTPDELLAMTFDESDRILGDRLLATGQSMVLCGAGGIGKSRLLLQMAAASRAGLPFISFETRNQDLRWVDFQAENSNRRLKDDFAVLRDWIGEKHWHRVQSGLLVHTLESDQDGFLSLDNDRTQTRIREAIAKYKPDVVCFDSLYNFADGDLNSDRDMADTLLAISRLSRAGNPNRAIVTLHHALTGRAGAARATGYDRASFGRNSKVLHSWARAQINVAPGAADNDEHLVLSCGKNSNGKPFETFAVRLDPQTMIYSLDESFDLSAWQSDVSGKRAESTMSVLRVGELCTGTLTKSELAAKIRGDCGCGKTASFNWVQRAANKNKIHWTKASETYVRTP